MIEQIGILKNVFGDCTRTDKSNCVSKTSYELINASHFYIVDEDNNDPVKIVGENDYYQLKITNTEENEICVLKTDKCLFNGGLRRRCDCVLFNDSKYFFVEISEAHKNTRKEKRKNAVEQLEATIEFFKAHDIELSTFSSKAIICFKAIKPFITKASLLSKRAAFYENYKIELEEGNEIEF
ncbi:MAG TPA: hypothetical protein VKT28_20065 [Puia sp.]|nr:hypothetical protein [Puia sp.]